MATEKAMYWLAVGVLALGVNSTFQNQESQWAHSVADRTTVALQCIAQRGLDYAVMAEAMLGRNPADSPRLQAALARLQAKTSSAQATLARQEAARTVMEAQRVHLEFNRRHLAYMAADRQLCSRRIMAQMPEIRVPEIRVPDVDVQAPGVHVHVPGLQTHVVSDADMQIPAVHVRVPVVRVQIQPVIERVQNLSSLSACQKLRILESLKNLPSASDFTISATDNMDLPQSPVQMDDDESGDSGPI